MGRLTVSSIITEGINAAGRSELATPALGWLQRWLDSVASSWDWPMLKKVQTAFPVANISDALALSGLPFGLGSSYPGSSKGVIEIDDDIQLYDANKINWYPIKLKKYTSNYKAFLPRSDRTLGTPTECYAEQSGLDAWKLHWWPLPDTTYYAVIPYKERPAAYITSDTPWYPTDETMVMAVKYKALEYTRGSAHEETVAVQQALATLLSNDRVRYVGRDAPNSVIEMDPNVFK